MHILIRTVDYLLLQFLELLAHFLDYLDFEGLHLLGGKRGSVVDSVHLEEGVLRGGAEPLAYRFRGFGAVGELIVRRVIFVPG